MLPAKGVWYHLSALHQCTCVDHVGYFGLSKPCIRRFRLLIGAGKQRRPPLFLTSTNSRGGRHWPPNSDGWEVRQFSIDIILMLSLYRLAAVERDVSTARVIGCHFGSDRSRHLHFLSISCKLRTGASQKPLIMAGCFPLNNNKQ